MNGLCSISSISATAHWHRCWSRTWTLKQVRVCSPQHLGFLQKSCQVSISGNGKFQWNWNKITPYYHIRAHAAFLFVKRLENDTVSVDIGTSVSKTWAKKKCMKNVTETFLFEICRFVLFTNVFGVFLGNIWNNIITKKVWNKYKGCWKASLFYAVRVHQLLSYVSLFLRIHVRLDPRQRTALLFLVVK